MNIFFDITGSIVLYKNHREILSKAINSYLNTQLLVKLYLIDNSPTDHLRDITSDPRVQYLHNPSNSGFGAAHNMAIDMAVKANSSYHFIINPDVYFDAGLITPMINYMEANKDVGMMMPQVLYPDNSIQYLPKLLPGPFWILKRKLKSLSGFYKKFIEKYELRNIPPQLIYNSPILSGCFSLLRLDVIKEVGAYDERFFMYFEDFDLSRRVHQKYKTIYYPFVSVYHGYASEANKSIKGFKIFIHSMVLYFNKWGWFFDKERKKINDRTLSQFQK